MIAGSAATANAEDFQQKGYYFILADSLCYRVFQLIIKLVMQLMLIRAKSINLLFILEGEGYDGLLLHLVVKETVVPQ